MRERGTPDGLGFVRNALVRSELETDPDDHLRRVRQPGGLAVALAGELVLLAGPEEAGTGLLPVESLALTPDATLVALGSLDGRPVAATQTGEGAAEGALAGRGFRAVDLRTIAVSGLVPADELGILAQAKSLLSWHARHGFCAHCGAGTVPSAGGLRRDCTRCGTQHFPRTDPVAIMLVARGDLCLLGRQRRFVAGSYSCLAGFISPGETLEDAVRREVKEEAGITVGAVGYVVSQPWPFPSSLMIGCRAEALDDVIRRDETELEDARWFGRAEVRLMLERRHPDGLITPPPMAIANYLLRDWLGLVS
ncbi:MAG: NAD(+) diphosphatase [Methylobacteriaceae bacterium]|nr:NAD(+) diphosphatase [Methylobacteriaceae bacterium]